jgi:prevent-host-death family protein
MLNVQPLPVSTTTYDHGTLTMVMSPSQKEITATQFKARCLRLLDEVAETGEMLVVTKHGRPVARVMPPLKPEDLRGSVKINMSDEELIYFSMGPWDMEQD